MAELEQNKPETGAVPPKISPITPHNPTVAPAAPGAPRPITIKIRRPPVIKKPGEAAPVTTPAAPAAPVPLKPVAAAPAASPLKPVAPVSAAPSPLKPVAPVSAAPSPLKPVTPVSAEVEGAPTIRLRPVKAPIPTAVHPVPGSNPLAPGPKPPSAAQIQASKSKTSRIALDTVIGVAPVEPEAAPKTIRLKRPSDIGAAPAHKPVSKSATAPIRQTSRIPESALSTETATVTQKKTLKIKRPGVKHAASAAPAASSEASASQEDTSFDNLTPIDSLNLAPVKSESSGFTVFAIVCSSIAIIALLLLTLCLGAHAMGPGANKNTLATIDGPDIPWIGKTVR